MIKEYTGRILRSLSGFYDVQTPEGLITCRGRGSLRKKGQTPLTGDMVTVSVENGKGMVEAVLHGVTALSVLRWQMWMRW